MKWNYILSVIFLSGIIYSCDLLDSGNEKIHLPGKIVFSARVEDGNYHIFTMNTDGSNLKQLTFSDFEYGAGEDPAGFNGVKPSWSPDGEQIVFSSFYKATSIGPFLWLMNADGSDLRPVKEYKTQYENKFHALEGNNPRWSPDGTRIAFDLCLNCQIFTNYVIFVFDIETEEVTRLTEEPPGYSSMYPAWSPDGTRIAFTANRDYVDAETERFRRDLYIMDAYGSNQRRLTNSGFPGVYTWMDTGKLILTTTERNTNLKNVSVLDVETTEAHPIMENLKVKNIFWIFWDPVRRQFLSINKNHRELPVVFASYDLNGNQLKEFQINEKALESAVGFDWIINIE